MRIKQNIKNHIISTLALGSVVSFSGIANADTQASTFPQPPTINLDINRLNSHKEFETVNVPLLKPLNTQLASAPIAMGENVSHPEIKQHIGSAPPRHSNYENQYIPVMASAKVFANLTDNLPAVLNYFIEIDEESIVNFYQKSYGPPTALERKRGILTLTYQQGVKSIRVIISPQGDKNQVDVLVSLNSA